MKLIPLSSVGCVGYDWNWVVFLIVLFLILFVWFVWLCVWVCLWCVDVWRQRFQVWIVDDYWHWKRHLSFSLRFNSFRAVGVDVTSLTPDNVLRHKVLLCSLCRPCDIALFCCGNRFVVLFLDVLLCFVSFILLYVGCTWCVRLSAVIMDNHICLSVHKLNFRYVSCA